MNTHIRFTASLTCAIACLVATMSASRAEDYDDYMKRIQKDMEKSGTQIDVFSQNPFQTGTALSGYYLNEKTLLLERDAFFQMKSNELKTTEEVADFQHRMKVLRAHGNNMLLQLIQAVDQRNKEGFTSIEGPKQSVELEKLVEECNKDAACVADRLQNPETSVKNVIVDNFALATQVFGQIPYMHVLEINSVYQLVNLIYLEVFYSQNYLSAVEFKIFYDKQKKIEKSIARNRNLSETERRLHTSMVVNTINKWKKRILQRKYDHNDEFKRKALELHAENKALIAQLTKIRGSHPELFEGLYDRHENCLSFVDFRKWRWCKHRKSLLKRIEKVEADEFEFLNEKEEKLPGKFWDEIGD